MSQASPSNADSSSDSAGFAASRAAAPFLLGVNYPWYHYGTDFGANVWGSGGVSDPRNLPGVDQDFAYFKGHGVRAIRWFIFCDGRASPEFDADGYVTGFDDRFYPDFDAALELARKHGLKLIPVLFNVNMTDPAKMEGGVQTGGRSALIADPAKRQSLFDNALAPLFRRYAERSEIAAWEVMNEPELGVAGIGGEANRVLVSFEAMRAFVGGIAALVHANATQPVTLGSWKRVDLQYWRGLGLDFYQFHYYDVDEIEDPLNVPYAELGLDKPCIVGEFPSKLTRLSVTQYLDTIWNNDYSGAMPWSYRATDPVSDFKGVANDYWAWARSHPTKPEVGPRP